MAHATAHSRPTAAEYLAGIPGTRRGMVPIDIDQLRAFLEVDEDYPLGVVRTLSPSEAARLALVLVRVN
ncbi:MAG: hypothetical protein JWO85_2663 [Candidatus Eremiobacteraeota bacterium]|nr:hypothetical protein [Candidatus Eremiobacteraeota bacterium]